MLTDLTGQFGFALKGSVDVDKASLRRSEKAIDDAIGKPRPGIKVGVGIASGETASAGGARSTYV